MQDASEDTMEKLIRFAKGLWNWYWHRGGKEWIQEHFGHAKAIERMQDFGKEPVAGDKFFHAEDTPQTRWSILKFDSADQAKQNAELLQSKGIECEAVRSDIVLREADAKRIAEEHLLTDSFESDNETIMSKEASDNLKNYEDVNSLEEAMKDPEFAKAFEQEATRDDLEVYAGAEPAIPDLTEYMAEKQEIAKTINDHGAHTQEHTLETIHNEITR